jgi:SDR family mycofactocin-dependent oxidoreductase
LEETLGLLDGKTAFITGAARGQGRAHAVALARAGASIVAVDIGHDLSSVPYRLGTREDLAETVAAVEAAGGEALAVLADVRSQAELDAAVSQGIERFGGIDVCVANAGILSVADFWALSEEQWSQMIDVNLGGPWRTAKAVAPHMMERRSGSIVIIASLNALEATSGLLHYTAAKHGGLGVMRTVALELAPYGVRCNAVCPGSTDTAMINWQGMYDRFAGHEGGGRADLERGAGFYHALAPAKVLPPEAIAEAVLWLASDLSAQVTGIYVPVDAGHLLLPGVNSRGA